MALATEMTLRAKARPANPHTGRLLIVSNRLPVTVRVDGDGVRFDSSSGGLATGMRGPHDQMGGRWIGWSGLSAALKGEGEAAVQRGFAERGLVPVALSAEEVRDYYEGFSNGVLWPLFHGFVALLPLEIEGFESYRRVNERFADVVCREYQEGDLIWVHDYQLMLLPQLLRERLPSARIGFFLHIPFPSSEIFRTLPFREELLAGILGADLIGFHTASYVRHFSSAVLRILGRSTEMGRISWRAREITAAVFPMGIDAYRFNALAQQARVAELMREFRGGFEGQTLLGIDRLDYTKGIPRRLLAFERLLQMAPELHGRVRLVQLAVPSRTNVDAYQEVRENVDGLIGRINGQFGTPSWTPVHYLYRNLSEQEVVALYRVADLMLVTPIRDGMNLVAKEFVASRSDEHGVLVLSEFAGAHAELAEALHVNPYDLKRTAEVCLAALRMPAEQRHKRMRALRRRVFDNDVRGWASTFVTQLQNTLPTRAGVHAPSPPAALEECCAALQRAPSLLLLLDYDGTLAPFAPTPELAGPDEELLSLLTRLSQRANTHVHIVSGRPKEALEEWLGALPMGLHAEHGLWSRLQGKAWQQRPIADSSWRQTAREILADWTHRTPGTLIEEKTASLAWHYRMAEPEFGASRANELRLHLASVLANAPVEIMPGECVVELRPHGVNKGAVLEKILPTCPPGVAILAIGDDRTDEDLFAALPAGAYSICVGPRATRARLRLRDVPDVRQLLFRLL